MTATTGFTSIGTLLKMGDGASPEVFTAIANVTGLNVPQTAGEIDATHLASTSGYKESKQGYKEATVSGTLHFDPDNTTHDDATGLMSKFVSGATTNYKLDFSAADNNGVGKPATDPIMTFAGVLTEFSISSETESMVTASFSIRLASAPTWGAS